jgi:hypothetical protein
VLADGVLRAANTGAPLDAPGVEALSTLRASAKRDDTTAGRFGVGFAAVLAVSDEPSITSRTGAVRWSLDAARELAAGVPGLADELRRRAGAVPALRLPLASADDPPPAGYATEVRLPLRDAGAERLARAALDAVDPTLLVALPALTEIEVVVDGATRVLRATWCAEDRVEIADDGSTTTWLVVRRSGELAPELLADRPVEERARRTWSVTWAASLDGAGRPGGLPPSVERVVRAPTPTDEPLDLPAVLVATLPLDPSRRRVAPGALADAVAEQAGAAYADLLAALPADPTVLGLVPSPVPAGAVDAAVRRAALGALARVPLLPTAGAPEDRARGGDAVVLAGADERLVSALAGVLPALLPAPWSGRSALVALRAIGVRELSLADVVDALSGIDREPAWWRELYDGLAAAVPPGPDRDALGALPVPLADGRLVTGPRGVVLLDGSSVALPGLDALGARVAHHAAAHPLLASLGAVVAGPRELLDDPRIRAAVAASYDADDPLPVAEAVLGLVSAAGVSAGELPWLAELALPGADGEWYPAGELLLPGGELDAIVADDAPFGIVAADVVERWEAAALTAVGVLDSFATVTDADVPVDPDLAEHDLDGEAAWLSDVADELPPDGWPAVLAELVAVRDLELVDPTAWNAALRLLARPPLRAAVVSPARVVVPGGRYVDVRPYTAWWLCRHDVLAGRRPTSWALTPLGGLFDVAPGEWDAEFLGALGVVRSLADAVEADPAVVVTRLADPERAVTRHAAREAHALLASVDPARLPPPDVVRAAMPDGVLGCVAADTAVVVDAPDLLPLLGGRPTVPVPARLAPALADVLDLALASELAGFAVRGESGASRAWSDLPGADVAAGRAGGLPDSPVITHTDLVVADADGRPVSVRWRATADADHVVAGSADALGRALAWRTGRWERRAALAEAFAAPDRARMLAEDDLVPPDQDASGAF